MAAKRKKNLYVLPEPDWTFLKQASTEEEKLQAFNKVDYFVHYEVDNKSRSSSAKNYIKSHEDISKEDKKILNSLPDWHFVHIGKYTWIAKKLGFLPVKYEENILKLVPDWLKFKTEESLAVTEEEKPENIKPVISIQERKREQVVNLCGNWEGKLDDLLAGNVEVKKFDPYNEMLAYEQGLIKANHAKIIKDIFQADYSEAQEIAQWEDADIKEAYGHLDLKARKAYIEFFEKINNACDTFIKTRKAQRKTRRPKAVSKERLVQKLKFKVNDGELGVASINPIDIIDAREVWVYNTKNRKLGIYCADDIGPGLSVKGASITGFMDSKSLQKTLRKPAEQLKSFKGNAKTKYAKAFTEIKATETKLNGRLNEHTIILKAF